MVSPDLSPTQHRAAPALGPVSRAAPTAASVLARRRQVVRRAAHELRNSLTGCRGHIELLGEPEGDTSETVAMVLEELDRMSRVVDDLQVIAEAELPEFLRFETVDLPALVHRVAVRAAVLGRRRWVLDAPTGGTVVVDPVRIVEAVLHLVRNAVQHSQPGDTVALGSALDRHEWRLWVRDAGPGLPFEVQQCAFEPFYRGPGAHRRYRGAGLGLTLVRMVAESHGGRVDIESPPGGGAAFLLVLPVDPRQGRR